MALQSSTYQCISYTNQISIALSVTVPPMEIYGCDGSYRLTGVWSIP